jgi:tRNA nucleotidyltransferase (CCA-adding enzyme)
MGRAVSDWDVATSALPKEVMRIFPRVAPTGIQHGTVSVIMDHVHYEVTTLRGEGAYSDGRRPDEVFFVKDIEEDLARRDFTVNAIAYEPTTHRIVDPHGGIEDLEKGVLRAVGDPLERFTEDGLRVLRGARFVATLELELDPATRAAIPKALSTYEKVSHERVRDEWLKAMKARRPSRAFEVMRETGILGVTLPELLEQVGCEQNRWHAYDVWKHTMECMDAAEGGPILRVAALLHDIGKPRTRERSEKTGDFTFYHHERVGADMARKWLHDYRFSNDERDEIVHLVRNHLICYSADWSDAAVRRFLARVGVTEVDRLLALGRADALAKGRPVDEELAGLAELRGRIDEVIAKGQALTAKDLAVGGEDVMTRLGIPPGRRVGDVLRALLDRVVESPELNERETLMRLIDEIGEKV